MVYQLKSKRSETELWTRSGSFRPPKVPLPRTRIHLVCVKCQFFSFTRSLILLFFLASFSITLSGRLGSKEGKSEARISLGKLPELGPPVSDCKVWGRPQARAAGSSNNHRNEERMGSGQHSHLGVSVSPLIGKFSRRIA